jgi:CRISPR-associated endoribonuclease Cas6
MTPSRQGGPVDLASVRVPISLVDERSHVPYFLGSAVRTWLFTQVDRHDLAYAVELDAGSQARPYTVSEPVGLRRDRTPGGEGRGGWFRVTALDERMAALLIDRIVPALQAEGKEVTAMLANVPVCLHIARIAVSVSAYRAVWARHLETEAAPSHQVGLHFVSPTTAFEIPRDGWREAFPYPVPEQVFGGLAERWNAGAPPGLALDSEEIATYAYSHMATARLEDLSTTRVSFEFMGEGDELCFRGKCAYQMMRPHPALSRRIHLLAEYAEWAGVGRRTTAGLGQVARWEPGGEARTFRKR